MKEGYSLTGRKARPILIGLNATQLASLAACSMVIFVAVVSKSSGSLYLVTLLLVIIILSMTFINRQGYPLGVHLLIVLGFRLSKDASPLERRHRRGGVRRKSRASTEPKNAKDLLHLNLREIDSVGTLLFESGAALGSVGFGLPARSYLFGGDAEQQAVATRWGSFLNKCADLIESKHGICVKVEVLPPWRSLEVADEGLSEMDIWLHNELRSRSWTTQSSFWIECAVGGGKQFQVPVKVRSLAAEVSSRFSSLFDLELRQPEVVSSYSPTVKSSRGERSLRICSKEVRQSYTETRLDDIWCRCFEVTGWPSGVFLPSRLYPLFQAIAPARTMFLEAKPFGRNRSVRTAERRRSEALANKRLRLRSGYVEKLSYASDEAELGRLESEVVAGHILFSYRVVFVVYGRTLLELATAERELFSLGSKVGVELVRLDGRHLGTLIQLVRKTGGV